MLADKATIQLKWADSYGGTVVTFTARIGLDCHAGARVGGWRCELHFSLDSDGSLLKIGFDVNTKYYVVSVPDSGHITVSLSPGGAAISAVGVGTQYKVKPAQ